MSTEKLEKAKQMALYIYKDVPQITGIDVNEDKLRIEIVDEKYRYMVFPDILGIPVQLTVKNL